MSISPTAPALSRAELEALALRFTAAFNQDDLDGVMEHFAEDAVYVPLTWHGGEDCLG